MNAHTDVVVLKDEAGNPAFVVVPYKKWLHQTQQTPGYVPDEVVGKMVMEEKTALRAWREYFDLTQAELAEKAGISQAALSQMESGGHKIQKRTREKLAQALGIASEQLK